MKRKILALTLVLALASSATPAFADDIKVKLNSDTVTFADQQPVIKNDRTLIPLRGVLEGMGITVDYDNASKTVYMYDNDTTAQLTIGKPSLFVNGVEEPLDTAPEIMNNRTMLPIRAVAEAFGAKVGWNEETKTVEITVPEKTVYKTTVEKGNAALEASDENYYSNATEIWSVKGEDGTELIDVNITYPQLNGKTAMDGSINAYIAKSAQTMAESFIDKDSQTAAAEKASLKDNYRMHSIYISFEDLYHNDNILSYLATSSIYLGGAHPSTYGYGMTFDLKTGKEVSVSDVAGDNSSTAISDTDRAVNYIKEQIKANPSEYMDNAADYVFADDTGCYGCYFGENKLIIFAAEGTIKPYAEGMVKFEAPLN